jgi:hypothetical protein
MAVALLTVIFFVIREFYLTNKKPQIDETWEDTIRKYNFVKDFQSIVHLFFMKDMINPKVFSGNFEYVKDSLDISFSVRLNRKTYKTSPTVTIFQDFTTRPLAFEDWFLAAYPDVAKWSMHNLENKMKDPAFRGIFEKEEYFIDKNIRKINHTALRHIIDYYKN